MGDAGYETILYEPDVVARIVLNRPRQRNAQNAQLLREFDDALGQASRDPRVRVIVVSGAGSDFSSGHDMTEIGADSTPSDDQSELAAFWQHHERSRHAYAETHLAWRNVPKPTIAMVHGYCIWGGWTLASTMDVIFAADSALFLPVANPGTYWTVAWDIGPRRAKELLFEERFMTAQEALEYGFVNRVYPEADLEQATLEYAGRVAEADPLRLNDVKFVVNQTVDEMGFPQSVRMAFQVGTARRRPSGQPSVEVGAPPDAPRKSLIARALERLPNRKPAP